MARMNPASGIPLGDSASMGHGYRWLIGGSLRDYLAQRTNTKVQEQAVIIIEFCESPAKIKATFIIIVTQ